MFREVMLVAEKDLRIEMRSKISVGQVAPFAVTVLFLFAFAVDVDHHLLDRAASGIYWITVLLATMLTVQRSFSVESTRDGRDGLRASGLDPAAVFLGKAAAVVVQLILMQLVLAAGIVLLYDISLNATLLILATCVTTTISIAAAGTLYGVLAAGVRSRETLLPLLFLPAVAPVLLAAARASEVALGSAAADGWAWVRLLTVFAVVYVAAGIMTFGPLLEDS